MQTRKIATMVIVVVALTLLLAASFTTAGPPVEESKLGALAPVGTAFTYQGRLTDEGGGANGSYDFQFELYDAAEGGSQVGDTVTQGDVLVSDGLFTVELDFGSAPFMGDARWLEIGVRPGGSTGAYNVLSPRHSLTAAPYALYALNGAWAGLTGVPAGFADGGVDNDTTYAAGTGLTLVGTTFSANTTYLQRRVSGTCASGNAIRVVNANGTVTCEPVDGGDAHDHWGETWSGSGVGLALASSNGHGLRVSTSGSENHGVFVDSAGGDGVHILSPDHRGVFIENAGWYGVSIAYTGWHGVYVGHAGQHGVVVSSATLDGVYVNGAGGHGVNVTEVGGNGVEVQGSTDHGVYANTYGEFGFYTPDKIRTFGGCVGCTSMLIAQNGDEELLEPGDLVAVAGLTDSVNPEAIQPILIVRKAESSFSQGVVGVVEGHYVYKVVTDQVPVERSMEGEEETVHSERMTESINEEPAAPGEYLSVVYQGLAKVKVDASSSPIKVGDLLSVSTTTGQAMKAQPLAIEGEKAAGGYLIGSVIGKALEPLNEGQGVIWVLVDLQ